MKQLSFLTSLFIMALVILLVGCGSNSTRVILVKRGSFTMREMWDDEKAVDEVTLTYDFYIGKYEVTFREYDAFCEATGMSKPSDQGWGRGERPVIDVSWLDAIAYCNWLSKKEKLPEAYDRYGNLLDKYGNTTTDPSKVVGYRLPTEAEWEYAASGGNKSKGYKYSGSSQLEEVGWYWLNSGDKTQEVGKKSPNELGIHDMSGNVNEWCSDWYDKYSEGATINPYNSSGSFYRSVRGGGWGCDEFDAYITSRNGGEPNEKANGLGFRICKTVPYEGKNRAPYVPNEPTPLNNKTILITEATLSWNSIDPDGDSITYDVYFDTTPNPKKLLVSGQTDKTLKLSTLSANTTYYWKILARDSKGATKEGPVWNFTVSPIDNGMIPVESGNFTMGNTGAEGFADEKPVHTVIINYNFLIGEFEVTFQQYDTFCEGTGRSKPDDEGWGRGSRPVINVTWWDAIDYCNWLSKKEKLPNAYDSNGNLLDKNGRITTDPSKVVGYRLPTEAEWEYAARGGNKSEGYKYSGSNNADEVAWYVVNSGDESLAAYSSGKLDIETIKNNNCRTQQVGTKVPNELGIYDMSGNVWEWCSDWSSSYSRSEQTNPFSNSGSFRVTRGGSWYQDAILIRLTYRGGLWPTGKDFEHGFRICRTVP